MVAALAQNTDPLFHISFVCLCIAHQSMSGTEKDCCLFRLESEYAWSKMGPVESSRFRIINESWL